MMARPLSRLNAIGEFIDNSIDAGAKNIDLHLTNEIISISDNGDGFENLSNVNTIFKSGNRGNISKIGQFGAGLQNGIFTLGSRADIISRDKCTYITEEKFISYDDERNHVNDINFE